MLILGIDPGLQRTGFGREMRATAQDPETAALVRRLEARGGIVRCSAPVTRIDVRVTR